MRRSRRCAAPARPRPHRRPRIDGDQLGQDVVMCRNIKTLANFDPPATDDEVRASALQFVRKLSGVTRPSRANEAVFERAVEEVTDAARRLVSSLQTTASPRNREEEARKGRERSEKRFGGAPA